MLAQLNGNGFYRLRSYATEKYMSIVNDTISAQKIVGGLSNLTSETGQENAMNRVQPFLQTDIKLVNQNSVFTDPGTVIYLDKTGSGASNKYDIISQGVGLKYISTCVYVGTSFLAKANGLKGMYAFIDNIKNTSLYTAYINLDVSFGIYGMNETRFFGDESGKVVMTSVDNSTNYANAPEKCHWYIEPLNLTDNYFAAAPISSFTQNGKYYTTLRTAFSYKVPSGSEVKVYKVTAMPSVEGELATTEEVSQGNIIPAGLPVVTESTSLETTNNMLQPFFDSSTAPIVKSTASFSPTNLILGTVSSASISVTGCTNSDVLYNGYGHHGHDCYTDVNHNTNSSVSYGKKLWPGWGPEGDNIGFFKNYISYYDVTTKKWTGGTTPIYKLGMKDGAVGFWEQVAVKEKISGNEAYSYKQCQLFPVEKELGDIAESGAENITYEVVDSEHLYGVRVVGEKLYAKDYGKYRNPSVKAGDAIDGMKRFYDYNEPYDQSNWVVLDVENPSNYVKKDLHVVGKLVNRANPEIKVSKIESKTAAISSYNLNTYSPASFMGTQASTVDGNTYFFVEPKPQEIVHIKWAVYDGDGKFYVEAPQGDINGPALKGGFVADGSFIGDLSSFTQGNVYEFDAVVKKNTTTSNISLKNTPYTGGGVSNNYVVYPLEAGMVVTGTSKLLVEPKVTSVKYYNLMGVESDAPFKGVNIVVTSYDNGTRSTSKVIK